MQTHLALKPYNQLLDYDSISTYIQICGYAVSIIFFILEAAGRALLGFFYRLFNYF